MPPASSVDIRTYGIGLFPFDGHFTTFQGALNYDPADRSRCSVTLSISVSSLVMANPGMRDAILGADFLDAVAFPALEFTGTCNDATLVGALTMHGVTHPVILDLTWRAEQLAVTGTLLRAAWGVSGHPFLAGPNVRIRVTAPLADTLGLQPAH